MYDDTIVAIATPPGEGGIGIIRISGPEALQILKRVVKPVKNKEWEKQISHTLHLGMVMSGSKEIDEVLVSIMKKPNSYTREDVVEINCHGGGAPLNATLSLALDAGARLAEPGEFTKRAFLNGRLDLSQAEAVIDIIRAKTGDALELAVKQLHGQLAAVIDQIQSCLMQVISLIEVNIDFTDDENESIEIMKIKMQLAEISEMIKEMISGSQQGRIYRDGFNVLVIGSPNAGKSTLFNRLLGEDRAIVTNIPGTTRDTIEGWFNVKGYPVRLIDSAGLRESNNEIEKLGIERTNKYINKADLVLWVSDVQRMGSEDEHVYEVVKGKRNVVKIINKIDLLNKPNEKSDKYRDYQRIDISAKTGEGVNQLIDLLHTKLQAGYDQGKNNLLISNIRHVNALKKTLDIIIEVMESIEKIPIDVASIRLREAWNNLGEINGKVFNEELLESIFTNFCVGK